MCICVGLLGSQIWVVRERYAVGRMLWERNARMRGLPSFAVDHQTVPWYRTLLGDEAVDCMFIDGQRFSESELCRIEVAFPEADIAVLDVKWNEIRRRLPWRGVGSAPGVP